jgi:hypothetical protein
MRQGRRDTYLGWAAIGGIVLLCVFGLVVMMSPQVPWFSRLALVVVVLVTVWAIRSGGSRPGESSVGRLALVVVVFFAVSGAAVVFFFITCLVTLRHMK